MYLSLIYIGLIVCSFMLLIEERCKKYNNVIYSILTLYLILLAGFRPEGMDNDFMTYVDYITDYDDPRYKLTVEWSFRYISMIFMNLFGNPRSVFILFAIIGVSIKSYAIKKLSPSLFAPICIYIGNYFVLHDFTQIRAGVASGLLLLAIYYIRDKKKVKAMLLIFAATFFHYSSLAFVAVLFLSTKELSVKSRVFWATVVPLGYIMYFSHIQLTSIPVPIAYFQNKIEMYQTLRDNGFIDKVNVFNLLFLLKIAIFYFLLFFYDHLRHLIPSLSLCLRIMGLSLFFFICFSDLPILSFRISEMFGIVEIILFPALLYTFKPTWFGKAMVITLSFALLFIHSFIDDILVVM